LLIETSLNHITYKRVIYDRLPFNPKGVDSLAKNGLVRIIIFTRLGGGFIPALACKIALPVKACNNHLTCYSV